MRPGRIVTLVIGCVLVIPAAGLLFGGGALAVGYAFGRGDDGYFDVTLERLRTDTVAVAAEDIEFGAEPGSPDWVFDVLDADVRLRATSADADGEVFVGIARERDVEAYLAGVAHDQIVEFDGREPIYERRPGDDEIAAPTEESFWTESASGTGTVELVWEATGGRWSVVLMNADGRPGVMADVNVGAKAGFVLPLAIIMLSVGAVLTAIAVTLIVYGALGARESSRPPAVPPPGRGPTSSPLPPPAAPTTPQ